MPKTLDLEGLVAALDAKRKAEGISWRELARQAGVSASTLTRMQQGKQPDVNTYNALLRWLRMPAEDFMRDESTGVKSTGEPHAMAVMSTLLRGKRRMPPKAKKALDELVLAAFKLAKEMKQ